MTESIYKLNSVCGELSNGNKNFQCIKIVANHNNDSSLVLQQRKRSLQNEMKVMITVFVQIDNNSSWNLWQFASKILSEHKKLSKMKTKNSK